MTTITEERIAPRSGGLACRLLGGVRLRVVDDPSAERVFDDPAWDDEAGNLRFRTHRCGLLLACLAASSGGSLTRAFLGARFWPDADDETQRKRLRDELSFLRVNLGDFLQTGRADIRLSAALPIDLREFERCFERGVRQQAIEERLPWFRRAHFLYAGPFLGTLRLSDDMTLGEVERDWVAEHRGRFERLFRDLNRGLIRDLTTVGLFDEARAIEHRERALLSEPSDTPGTDPSPRQTPARANAHGKRPPAAPPDFRGPDSRPPDSRRPDFVGREHETQVILRWARAFLGADEDDSRPFLTLTGAGGIGKSRLAREIPRHLTGLGAVFVDLSTLVDADRILDAIHAALGLIRQPDLTPFDQLVAALRARGPSLVALDNVEQFGGDARGPIETLAARCPETRFLMTSRRPVGLSGERVLPLHPLGPVLARALFTRRAHAARPEFLSETPDALIDEIVALLDGIPLALELAAARAALLTSGQMRRRAIDRLRFLTTVNPHRPVRHRSLRASLQWSVEQLGDGARDALPRLSVFAGGIPLAALDSVLGDLGDPLELLEELHLNALLIATPDTPTEPDAPDSAPPDSTQGDAGMRYALLPIVHDFCRELLETRDAEIGERVRRDHARFFCDMARTMRASIEQGRWNDARRLMAREEHNFRAAFRTAIAGIGPTPPGDPTPSEGVGLLLSFLEQLGASWIEMGYWRDVESLLHGLVVASPDPNDFEPEIVPFAMEPAQQCRFLGLYGALARRRGNERIARRCWERKLALQDAMASDVEFEETRATDGRIGTIFDLCGQAIDQGEFDRASELLETGARLARQASIKTREVVAAVLDARLALARNELSEARRHAELAHRLWRELPGDPATTRSLWFYLTLYTLPVFRADSRRTDGAENGGAATFSRLAVEAVARAADAGQHFLAARALDEIGDFALDNPDAAFATDEILLAVLFLSAAIHRELGTRLEQVAEARLSRYLATADTHAAVDESSREVDSPAREKRLSDLRNNPWQHSLRELARFLSRIDR